MLTQRYSGQKELSDGRTLRIDFTQLYDPGDGFNDPPESEDYDHEYSIDGVVVDYLDLPEEADEEFCNQVMVNAEPIPYNFGPPDDYWDD